MPKAAPAKELVGGKGFAYLGRSYRLKLVDEQSVALKLATGRFRLRIQYPHGWLAQRMADFRNHMAISPDRVKVQDLGYRWGSCGKGDWLYFHRKITLLPAPIAEYVLVHELAHLHEPHHTPEFWLRVERAITDYARRKTWLADHGIEVEGI